MYNINIHLKEGKERWIGKEEQATTAKTVQIGVHEEYHQKTRSMLRKKRVDMGRSNMLNKRYGTPGRRTTRLEAIEVCTVPGRTKTSEFIQAEVEKKIDAGVFQTDQSKWAATVLLLRKKDGKLRVLVDYRNQHSFSV